MYEKMKEKIEEIVSICEKVNEGYRTKCFEVLMQSLLSDSKNFAPQEFPVKQVIKQEVVKKPFVTPVQVKAFMSQYGITEDNLNKIFLLEGENAEPIFNLKAKKAAKAQIQLSLLKALENALKNSGFKFSVEEVRELCKKHKCYDNANFSSIFKKYSNLFDSLEDGENVSLSPEGKQQLADSIVEIAV